MVTDYDCWRSGEDAVEVSAILAQLRANAEAAREFVLALARALPEQRPPSPIDRTLDTALITAPEARDPAVLAKLDAVCGRVLKASA
jgi:5'-methylthioadenosine phosphorylase